MTRTGIRWISIGFGAAALTSIVGCGSTPLAPTPSAVSQTPTAAPAPAPTATATVAAPAPKFPIGFEQVVILKPNLVVANAVVSGKSDPVTYQFEVSELDSFPAGNRTSTSDSVPQGDNVTSWQPPSNLISGFLYYWHARASSGTLTSEWSKTETFRTP